MTSEPRGRPPRYHFDPARGDLPTDRTAIAQWCVSQTFCPEHGVPPSVTELLEAGGTTPEEGRDRLVPVLTRAIGATADFIRDLAREFGFDPTVGQSTILKEMLFHQIDIEAAQEMEGASEAGRDVMDKYRQTVRDMVAIDAIQTAVGDSLQTLADVTTAEPMAHVQGEVLLEEIVDILRRTVEGHASWPPAQDG